MTGQKSTISVPKTAALNERKKEARVIAISKFLEADERNTIPTSVILAFREAMVSFEVNKANSHLGKLSVAGGVRAVATIVDGQHRLYGINRFDPNAHVAVVGLLEVDDVEKAFQFLVINNKSSRVPVTHTKALLAKMKGTELAKRLKGARLAFDVEGIKDVDLINSDPDSPFYQNVDWTTTPQESRIVPATAIELSLDYLGNLGLPELEDRDTRRSVFLTMWRVIKTQWGSLWKPNSRLVSKVGIICLSRFIADRITNWADSEELDIEITDLGEIEELTRNIIKYMDKRFWTTPWAEKAQGGFDTNQGRDRVLTAIVQLYRNSRRDVEWYADVEIIDRAAAAKS